MQKLARQMVDDDLYSAADAKKILIEIWPELSSNSEQLKQMTTQLLRECVAIRLNDVRCV